MPLFQQPRVTKPKHTLKTIQESIKTTQALIPAQGEKLLAFEELLKKRIAEFEEELIKTEPQSSERKAILDQYNRFAQTFHECIAIPRNSGRAIKTYLDCEYHAVHVDIIDNSSSFGRSMAHPTLWIGIGLFLVGLAAFAINPIIGAGMIATAVSLIVSSAAYLFSTEVQDVVGKKAEEKSLFKAGVELMKADAEPQNISGCPSY